MTLSINGYKVVVAIALLCINGQLIRGYKCFKINATISPCVTDKIVAKIDRVSQPAHGIGTGTLTVFRLAATSL